MAGRAGVQILLFEGVGAGDVAGHQARHGGFEAVAAALEIRVFPGGLQVQRLGLAEASRNQVHISHRIQRVGVSGRRAR